MGDPSARGFEFGQKPVVCRTFEHIYSAASGVNHKQPPCHFLSGIATGTDSGKAVPEENTCEWQRMNRKDGSASAHCEKEYAPVASLPTFNSFFTFFA
jgi:hypothetical protein